VRKLAPGSRDNDSLRRAGSCRRRGKHCKGKGCQAGETSCSGRGGVLDPSLMRVVRRRSWPHAPILSRCSPASRPRSNRGPVAVSGRQNVKGIRPLICVPAQQWCGARNSTRTRGLRVGYFLYLNVSPDVG
jgi:hypothetical protein